MKKIGFVKCDIWPNEEETRWRFPCTISEDGTHSLGGWKLDETAARNAYHEFIKFLKENQNKITRIYWFSRCDNNFAFQCFDIPQQSGVAQYTLNVEGVEISASSTDGRDIDLFDVEIKNVTPDILEKLVNFDSSGVYNINMPNFAVTLKS